MNLKIDRSYAGIVRLATVAVSIVMVLYHMWAIAFGSPEAIWFRGTHLLFALVLTFLTFAFTGSPDGRPRIVDYVLLALGAAPIFYLFYYYDYVVNRIFYVDDLYLSDKIMGCIMVVVLLEAVRRVLGWALPITAILFLGYGLFVAQLEPQRLIDQLFMGTEGIFGIPLAVSATYVLIFVVFGAFMERTGTGQLFMDFATGLTGHAAGGPGKVAVVSSSLFGTISGSAVANVMVTGQISIPLMKRTGFKPGVRRRGGGGGLDRRADHAADHGRRRFRHGRVPRRLLRPGGDLGHHSGCALLSRLLLGGALRGQAPRPRRPAALRIA